MKATASDLNKHSGKLLLDSQREPIYIQRSGHDVSVLVSAEWYEELEDAYWSLKAKERMKEKSVGVKKTKEFLDSIK
jgi:PHD/YefM family antitoxin component YafN of YafNO toxin-antitoxin module